MDEAKNKKWYNLSQNPPSHDIIVAETSAFVLKKRLKLMLVVVA